MTTRTAIVAALAMLSCGGLPEQDSFGTDEQGLSSVFSPLEDSNLKIFSTPSPDGHAPIIDAIEGAKTSVYMTMYRMTDVSVVDALVAAHERGVTVKVILDSASLANSGYDAAYKTLKAAHVSVYASSSQFTITHEKSMVVDGNTAYITSMNMTNDFTTTRDFGIETKDSSVVKEWTSVFNADVSNAENETGNTPSLTVPSLVWSPVNSAPKLVALIGTAKSSILATVESLNDAQIITALDSAAKAGVKVSVIVPECDKNPNPLLDYPSLSTLASHGASVRVMPYPESAAKPYMHSKMLLVDGTVAYIGSVNYTTDSTESARECGIIFSNAAATTTIGSAFHADWAVADTVPSPLPNYCPSVD